MADKNVRIAAEVEVNTGNSSQKVGDIKKGLRDVGSEAQKSSKEVSQSMEKIGDSLGSVSPAAKRATEGIKGFNTILNVLKANPIIATIAALTGLMIALFQPFKKMEAVSDSLGKAFGTLGGVFTTFINSILTPLIGGFTKLVELTTNGLVFALDLLGVTSKETADRLGEITESLDDLEDAERDSALATAESNRKLQEAREIAADANVPIRQRIDALKEAGRIEKEELDKVVQINRTKAALMLEQIGIELGARDGLIKKIKEGSLESLKAARAELAAMKNVDKDKLYAIDQMIIAADNAGAQSAKISKKVQSQITGIEKEEEAKRKEQRAKADEAKRKADEKKLKEEEDRKKKEADANKVLIDAYISSLKAQDQEEYKLGQEHNARMKALRLAGIEDTKSVEEQYERDLAAIRKKYADEEAAKKEADKKKKESDDASEKAKEKEAADKKRADDILGVENSLAEEGIAFDRRRQLIKDKETLILSDTSLTENQRKAIRRETKDAINKIDEEEANAKIQYLQAVGNATEVLSEIVGKQTAAGKALGIASALMNTYIGASEVIRAKSTIPEPFGTISKIASVAAIVATGLKTVRSITAVQVPGGYGGGGSTPSVPSMNVSAPLQSQPVTTTLNQAQVNQIGNVAARAYVVESDVTNAQERADRLNRAATIM